MLFRSKLAQQVRRVEWQQTAGELGALLLEARLVKERKPTENRKLRDDEAIFGLRFDPARKRGPVLYHPGRALGEMRRRSSHLGRRLQQVPMPLPRIVLVPFLVDRAECAAHI